MTAVATGAALYASTIDSEMNEENIQSESILLDVGYESTTVETSEWISVKLKTSAYSSVWVEFVRGDKGWSSGKVPINEMGDVIEVNLMEGKSNSFSIKAYDEKGNQKSCFPNELVIIQGTKVGNAVLPYNIGIATWDEQKQKAVFSVLQGLEKNKPLPAIGVRNGLKTTYNLRPNMKDDTIRIPVYQAEENSEGRSASIYEYVADVIITGEDVNTTIPENSNVDITLKVDSSEMMVMEVFFPSLDLTINKDLDTSKKQSLEEAERFISEEIVNVQFRLKKMEQMGFEVSSLQQDLDTVVNENENSSEKKAIQQHLKEVLRKLEQLEYSTEWERLEKELNNEFERLKKTNQDLGNEKSSQIVAQIQSRKDQVIQSKNIELGHELLKQIDNLFVQLTMVYQCMGLIQSLNERFDSIQWLDRTRARQAINRGLVAMRSYPTAEILQPIAVELIDLLPQRERDNAGGLLGKG